MIDYLLKRNHDASCTPCCGCYRSIKALEKLLRQEGENGVFISFYADRNADQKSASGIMKRIGIQQGQGIWAIS